MAVTGEKLNTGRETRPSPTSSTANMTWNVLGSSLDLCVERKVTDGISHGTASLRTKINLFHLKIQFEPRNEHYYSRL